MTARAKPAQPSRRAPHGKPELTKAVSFRADEALHKACVQRGSAWVREAVRAAIKAAS